MDEVSYKASPLISNKVVFLGSLGKELPLVFETIYRQQYGVKYH